MTIDTIQRELGKRIPAKKLARLLGVDVSTLRKHYPFYGGIRPPGQRSRILFFEMNVVNALRRASYGNIKDENSERKGGEAMVCASAEKRNHSDKGISNQEGSPGLGSRKKKRGLVEDPHGLLDNA